jgi:hypothetical protein
MNRLTYVVAAMLLALTACQDPCEGVEQELIGSESFTVTYQNPAGVNYLAGTYNPARIVVFVDTTGGEDPTPKFRLLQPGYANGSFGPFAYTSDFVNKATRAVNYSFLAAQLYSHDYYIKKDTFGVDTFRVEFLLGADACHYFWESIRYYRNGDPLPQFDDQPNPAIVITE